MKYMSAPVSERYFSVYDQEYYSVILTSHINSSNIYERKDNYIVRYTVKTKSNNVIFRHF